jgi:hypothetical protein
MRIARKPVPVVLVRTGAVLRREGGEGERPEVDGPRAGANEGPDPKDPENFEPKFRKLQRISNGLPSDTTFYLFHLSDLTDTESRGKAEGEEPGGGAA